MHPWRDSIPRPPSLTSSTSTLGPSRSVLSSTNHQAPRPLFPIRPLASCRPSRSVAPLPTRTPQRADRKSQANKDRTKREKQQKQQKKQTKHKETHSSMNEKKRKRKRKKTRSQGPRSSKTTGQRLTFVLNLHVPPFSLLPSRPLPPLVPLPVPTSTSTPTSTPTPVPSHLFLRALSFQVQRAWTAT